MNQYWRHQMAVRATLGQPKPLFGSQGDCLHEPLAPVHGNYMAFLGFPEYWLNLGRVFIQAHRDFAVEHYNGLDHPIRCAFYMSAKGSRHPFLRLYRDGRTDDPMNESIQVRYAHAIVWCGIRRKVIVKFIKIDHFIASGFSLPPSPPYTHDIYALCFSA